MPEFARVCKNPESNEAKWLYLVAKAGDEEELPDFGDPVFERAADRIRVNSASEELLKRQAREMVAQDEIDVRLVDAERLGLQRGLAKGEKLGMAKGEKLGLEKGLEKGMQQGMQLGMQQGEKKGRGEERESIARKMLAKGMPLSEIADITGFSEKEIRALKKS